MNRTEILEYAKKIATIDITKESLPISGAKIIEMSKALIATTQELYELEMKYLEEKNK